MDINKILSMAANVQAEMGKAQAKLELIEVEGQAGGGLVKLVATAKGTIKSIHLDESLMVKEEKTLLEDLIIAALHDARAKADAVSSAEMGKMTEGLPLPPGFKLPV